MAISIACGAIQAGPMYDYGSDDAVLRISTGYLIGPLYFEVIQHSSVDGCGDGLIVGTT
jgi:hypothetical protein